MAKKESAKDRVIRAAEERRQSRRAREAKASAYQPKEKPSDKLEKRVKMGKAGPAMVPPRKAPGLTEAVEERIQRLAVEHQDALRQIGDMSTATGFLNKKYKEEYGESITKYEPDMVRTKEIIAQAQGGEVRATLSPVEEIEAARASKKLHKATPRQGLQDASAAEEAAVTQEIRLRNKAGLDPSAELPVAAPAPPVPVTISPEAAAWAEAGGGPEVALDEAAVLPKPGVPKARARYQNLSTSQRLQKARVQLAGMIAPDAEASAALKAISEQLADKPPMTAVPPPRMTPRGGAAPGPSEPNFAPPIEPEFPSPVGMGARSSKAFARGGMAAEAPPPNTGGTIPSPKPTKAGKWFSRGEKLLGGLGLATMFVPSMVQALKGLTGRDEEEYYRDRNREAKLALMQYSGELRHADVQDRLDALVERRHALLTQNDPGLAQIIAGMRELNPDEGIIGGKPPSQERVKNFVLGEAIASGAAQQAMGE